MPAQSTNGRQRSSSSHWLALAKSMEAQTPGLLPQDWKARANDALAEMNEGVYGGGLDSLSNAKKRAAEEKAKEKTKSEDEP